MTAQGRLIWRRHAEAFPNHGTQRLHNDDDDGVNCKAFVTVQPTGYRTI